MKKSKRPELKTVDELEEEAPVERLKVNMHGAEDGAGSEIDDIDSLLSEKRLVDDEELDKLFSDEKRSKYDDVEIEVRKALYQPKTSNAQLLRANKSAEVINKTRSEEISKYKTLEDDWDGVLEEEAKAGKPVLYTALTLLALIIGAGTWALWNVSKNDQVANKDIHESRKKAQLELEKVTAAAAIEIKKVEKVVKQFVDAETLEEKRNLFHDSANLKDQITAYYQIPENKDDYINVNIVRVVEELIGKHKMWTAICSYGYSTDIKHEFFFLHRQTNGDYKLDWKAIAGIQESDWRTFVNEQSSKPIEIRVIVEPKILDGHYNWGFSDNEYSAYKLTLNDEQIFWGYVKNDNKELVSKMNETIINMSGFQSFYKTLDLKMILKVKFHENTHELNKQCVEITEIVSPYWLDFRDEELEIDAEENPQE